MMSVIGTSTGPDTAYIVTQLIEKGLVEGEAVYDLAKVRLTLNGWAEHDRLMRATVDSRRAFMAMPFGRADLDEAYEVFKVAVGHTGFE